jgi:hypothetical protein
MAKANFLSKKCDFEKKSSLLLENASAGKGGRARASNTSHDCPAHFAPGHGTIAAADSFLYTGR